MRFCLLWLGLPAAAAAGAGAVGLDVGSANSVVAVARRGGVDVVARSTPSLVAFEGERRKAGESAASSRTGSPGNCVSPRPLLAAAAGAEVEYCGKRRQFSAVQLFAMLLRHLLDAADRDHGSELKDAVIAVPHRFTPAQRRAVMNSAELAGTRCLGLLSEGAAAALDYALSRTDLSKNSERLVAFVDAGHTATQACVVAIKKGQLRMVAHTHAEGAGGQALDALLTEHFSSEIVSRYGIDPRSGPRPAERLRAACATLRHVLSANKEASFSLDCLVGEVDVSCSLSREALDSMSAPVVAAAAAACEALLREAKLETATLHSVEIVGGLSRMPALAEAVAATMGQPLRRSLNADEAVARGAALAAALASRHFKAKAFQVTECLGSALVFEWAGGEAADSRRVEPGTPLPWASTEELGAAAALRCTCSLAGSGAEAASPANSVSSTGKGSVPSVSSPTSGSSGSPAGSRLLLSSVVGSGAKRSVLQWGGGAKAGAGARVRLEMSVDSSGIPHLSASLLVEGATEEAAAGEGSAGEGAVGEGAAGEAALEDEAEFGELPSEDEGEGEGEVSAAPSASGAPPPAASPPLRASPAPLTVEAALGLSASALGSLRTSEAEMASRDSAIERTLEAKNHLEAQIYSARDAISDQLAPYISEGEAARLRATLEELEDWLYGEGAYVGSEAYRAKEAVIADALAPIQRRERLYEERTAAVAALRALADRAKAQAAEESAGAAVLEAEAEPLRRLAGFRSALSDAADIAVAAAGALEAVLEGPREREAAAVSSAVSAAVAARAALEEAARMAKEAAKGVGAAARAAREAAVAAKREAEAALKAKEEEQAPDEAGDEEQAKDAAVE